MKPHSLQEFVHLLKFQFKNFASGYGFWIFSAVLLSGIVIAFVFGISQTSSTNINHLGTSHLNIFYFVILQQFLISSSIDHKKPHGRFLSENDFISALPLSLRTLFYSKTFFMLGILLLPFLMDSGDKILSPILEIRADKELLPFLLKIQFLFPQSTLENPLGYPQLLIPHGSIILLQIGLLFPLTIILIHLAAFYYLRNRLSPQYRFTVVYFLSGLPIWVVLLDRILFDRASVYTSFFIWFYHWRYWVLGGLIFSLIALIIFLGKKAEAREEF